MFRAVFVHYNLPRLWNQPSDEGVKYFQWPGGPGGPSQSMPSPEDNDCPDPCDTELLCPIPNITPIQTWIPPCLLWGLASCAPPGILRDWAISRGQQHVLFGTAIPYCVVWHAVCLSHSRQTIPFRPLWTLMLWTFLYSFLVYVTSHFCQQKCNFSLLPTHLGGHPGSEDVWAFGFNAHWQAVFLLFFSSLPTLFFNFMKSDRKPSSSPPTNTPFIDPAVHSTSNYSSYLAWRPKEERKVKTDVKLSWLLWLKRNLGEVKPAVVSISRAGRPGIGDWLGFQNGCIQQ